jgi:hypothetical protein
LGDTFLVRSPPITPTCAPKKPVAGLRDTHARERAADEVPRIDNLLIVARFRAAAFEADDELHAGRTAVNGTPPGLGCDTQLKRPVA